MSRLMKVESMAKKKLVRRDDWAVGKPMAVQIRGSSEWKEWVERVAKFDRSTVSDIVDRAIAAYARSIGFVEVPPVR